MHWIIRRQVAHALCLGLALPACGADVGGVETPENVSVVDAAATSASTGQGIMVDVKVAGSLALVTDRTYQFNAANAATYFTSAGPPSLEENCQGDGCSYCAAPSVPAPPPSEAALMETVQNLQCNPFFSGGVTRPIFYTQAASWTATVECITPTLSAVRADYHYVWTYRYVPTLSFVSPLTAWELKDETDGGNTASINVTALIAGESVVSSKAQPRKYSFSLLESDGTVRVQDLAYSLDGAAPTPVTSTYVQNSPGATAGAPGALDFKYVTNAGSNGDLSLLANGDARTILNTDSFAGNQDGGTDGSALAAVKTAPIPLQLSVGNHSLVLTGKVKDNAVQSSSALNVTTVFHDVAPACGSH